MPSDTELILTPTESTLMLLTSILDAEEEEDLLHVRLLLSAGGQGKGKESGLQKLELVRRKRQSENSTQDTTAEGGYYVTNGLMLVLTILYSRATLSTRYARIMHSLPNTRSFHLQLQISSYVCMHEAIQ